MGVSRSDSIFKDLVMTDQPHSWWCNRVPLSPWGQTCQVWLCIQVGDRKLLAGVPGSVGAVAGQGCQTSRGPHCEGAPQRGVLQVDLANRHVFRTQHQFPIQPPLQRRWWSAHAVAGTSHPGCNSAAAWRGQDPGRSCEYREEGGQWGERIWRSHLTSGLTKTIVITTSSNSGLFLVLSQSNFECRPYNKQSDWTEKQSKNWNE